MANASRASSTDIGRSVSIQTLSEWARNAGTRTHDEGLAGTTDRTIHIVDGKIQEPVSLPSELID